MHHRHYPPSWHSHWPVCAARAYLVAVEAINTAHFGSCRRPGVGARGRVSRPEGVTQWLPGAGLPLPTAPPPHGAGSSRGNGRADRRATDRGE